MIIAIDTAISKEKCIFAKFIYQGVNYSGLIYKVIQDKKKHKYAFYIDINLLQRMTKIRHLKKLRNLNDEIIDEKFIEEKVGLIETDFDDLFSFEAREKIDKYKDSLNQIISILEKERDRDFKNFNLQKYNTM
jgi:hypothetical protein